MAKKRGRYARAQVRSKFRRNRRKRSSGMFYSVITLLVIGGIAMVYFLGFTAKTNAAGEAPHPIDPATGQFVDHWHEAIAVNYCGNWMGPPPTFETVADNPNVRAGIHTHGDGFIHIHPYTLSESGAHATLGRFLSYGGWTATADSFSLWPSLANPTSAPEAVKASNGDKCPAGSAFPGKAGVVKWSLDCKEEHGNPSDLKLANLKVITLAFVPKDETIGVPPNASSAPSNDGSQAGPLSIASCSTAGPGATNATPTTSTPTTSSVATTTTTKK
jgi:hypothetical protein